MNKKPDYITKILIKHEQIEKAINKAASWVNINYKNKVPLIIGILNGCIPFYGQLLSKIKVDCKCDFVKIVSYLGKNSSQQKPKILTNLLLDVHKQDILIVEDVIDSGNTLARFKKMLLAQGAKSVKLLCLLDKKSKIKSRIQPDYACFKIDDLFVVGFGLDYNDKLRNLPFVGVFNQKYLNKI